MNTWCHVNRKYVGVKPCADSRGCRIRCALTATWGESRVWSAVESGSSRFHRTLICNSAPFLQKRLIIAEGDRRQREGEGSSSFPPSLLSFPSQNPPPALSQLLSPCMNAPSGPMTSRAWNAWLPPEISSRAPRRHMLLMTSTQWAAARFFSLRLWPASPLTLPPSASSSTPSLLSSSFSPVHRPELSKQHL